MTEGLIFNLKDFYKVDVLNTINPVANRIVNQTFNMKNNSDDTLIFRLETTKRGRLRLYFEIFKIKITISEKVREKLIMRHNSRVIHEVVRRWKGERTDTQSQRC